MIDISALKDRITKTEFEDAVRNLIASEFADSDAFHVIEERRLYKASEDEYIWEQNKGLKPHVCEVYYKGEFVMDVPSSMQPRDAVITMKDKVDWINKEREKKKGT